MSVQDDLTHTFTQLTQHQLQAALLEMTGDLAKAEVLQKRLPGWMINAPQGVLEALETDGARAEEAGAAVADRLRSLRPLDEFCNERLKAYCQAQWQVTVEPKKDLFVRAVYAYETDVLPLEYVRSVTLEQQSLLHMALQNFSADEARAQHYPGESRLQSAGAARGMIAVAPREFAQGCRALDLGRLYQRHISEVFKLDTDEQPGQLIHGKWRGIACPPCCPIR